jgi:hypothetical protein
MINIYIFFTADSHIFLAVRAIYWILKSQSQTSSCSPGSENSESISIKRGGFLFSLSHTSRPSIHYLNV